MAGRGHINISNTNTPVREAVSQKFDIDSGGVRFGLGRGRFFNHLDQPTLDSVFESPVHCSTQRTVHQPTVGAEQLHMDLTTLVTELAQQIGNSISLNLRNNNNMGSVSLGGDSVVRDSCTHPHADSHAGSPAHSNTNSNANCLDALSGFKLVMQPDVKVPPTYRGDGDDKCSIHEWEELMTIYLKKRGCPVREQADEIMARLMGKARDLVKIKLRSDPSLDSVQNPYVIFDILKQSFSDLAYSCMPLADFYNTIPRVGESVMDYWIRLNKAVDIATECLRRQGRKIENPNLEVVMMFIKHCPDEGLAGIFRFKSAEKWSLSEVHERLDDYQRDKRAKDVTKPTECSRPKHVAAQILTSHDELSVPAPLLPTAQCPSCNPDPDVGKLVSLLSRVLENNVQLNTVSQSLSQNSQSAQRHALPLRSCKVCGFDDHSTLLHCRQEGLCFLCFEAGHQRQNCQKRNNTRPEKKQVIQNHQQLN